MELPTIAAGHRHHTAPDLGIIAEELQGALSAASRLQQRGVTVKIVSRSYAYEGDAQAVIVDLDLDTGLGSEHATQQSRVTAEWLTEIGCKAIEQRIDSLLRGSPAEVLRGFRAACELPDTLIAVVPAYPSAGRICLNGSMMSIDENGQPSQFDVAAALDLDLESVATIGVEPLTAGLDSTIEELDRAVGGGATVLVFDGTTEGHLRITDQAIQELMNRGCSVLTVSTGAWLRYYPDLHSDGFVAIAAPAKNKIDHRQVRSVGDVYGQSAVFLSPDDIESASTRHLERLISDYRVIVLQGTDQTGSVGLRARRFGAAIRRLLDAGRNGNHPCMGVIVSGGVTSGSVIKALDPVSLRPGNELEPLSPVVRLVGGPFSNVPVVTKASGIGSEEMMVRLVRRILGT